MTDSASRENRVAVSYFCGQGHVTTPEFSAEVNPKDWPEAINCVTCGSPAGLDPANIPTDEKNDVYKTHLDYVKDRRSPEDAEEILKDALARVQERRNRFKGGA